MTRRWDLIVWAGGRWVTALRRVTHDRALNGSLEFTRFKITEAKR